MSDNPRYSLLTPDNVPSMGDWLRQEMTAFFRVYTLEKAGGLVVSGSKKTKEDALQSMTIKGRFIEIDSYRQGANPPLYEFRSFSGRTVMLHSPEGLEITLISESEQFPNQPFPIHADTYGASSSIANTMPLGFQRLCSQAFRIARPSRPEPAEIAE